MSTEEFDRRIDAGEDSTVPTASALQARHAPRFGRRREGDFQAIFDQNLVVRKD
jgi:hypothetical protein